MSGHRQAPNGWKQCISRRRFEPNLHTHRFWVEAEKRFVKLRVSTKGMRIIDKKGIEQVLSELLARGEKV
jgi:large subunit ribosomal protein L28